MGWNRNHRAHGRGSVAGQAQNARDDDSSVASIEGEFRDVDIERRVNSNGERDAPSRRWFGQECERNLSG